MSSKIWTQTGGSPTVTLSGGGVDPCTFTSPGTIAGTTLTFTLTVTNDVPASDTDTMTVATLPVTERAVIGGVEVPIHVVTPGR